MIDIVGDVHGHATKLVELLTSLGYEERKANEFVHPDPQRKICFLGDLIDRGAEIVRTVLIVKKLVESGRGYCIIGNHEYNYFCYLTKRKTLPAGRRPRVRYCRRHNKRHREENRETRKQFKALGDGGAALQRWLFSLPLYLEIGGIRLVHAAWHEAAIRRLAGFSTLIPKEEKKVGTEKVLIGPRLTEAFVQQAAAADKATTENERRTVELILKGPEVFLGETHAFRDNDNNERRRARLRWWLRQGEQTQRLSALTLISSAQPEEIARFNKLLARDFNLDELSEEGYGASEPPVFFGHYWCRGTPQLIADNLCCLDYSIANKKIAGKLVAYCYSGERHLKKEHLHWV